MGTVKDKRRKPEYTSGMYIVAALPIVLLIYIVSALYYFSH